MGVEAFSISGPSRSHDSDVELAKVADGKRYNVEIPQYGDNQGVDRLLKDPLISDTKAWLSRRKDRSKQVIKTYTWWDWLTTILPALVWIRAYKRADLLRDVLAGVSVAALVIPQGMSYAKLAGLPNQYGLYGAFVPVIIYATLGSSRHLAVGPVAVTSLLLGTGLKNVVNAKIQADPNSPTDPYAQQLYNEAAVQVALLAGIMYSLVGFLQLGWIINFLSHSVIAGFTTGASVIIGLQQVKFFFGYNSYTIPVPKGAPKGTQPVTVTFPRNDAIYKQLHDIFGPQWTPYFKWREFIMGGAFLVILLVMKFLGKRYKKLFYLRCCGPLVVCVLGIAIVNIFKLQCNTNKKTSNDSSCNSHIRVVGAIPKGLPGETVTWWFPMPDFGAKLGYAVVICLIDITESISIAKALAYKNHYLLSYGKELRGLGLANIAGAMFNTYTTTGSFSRSAVMDQCGARSQLAAYISAILVGFTLLVLTPVFKNMPQNAQGAIIVSAIIGLFNYSEWFFLWKVNKLDWLVFNATWIGVMMLGVEKGLAVGVGISILLVLYKSGFPHLAVLGRLPETTVYRNVKQYPEAQQLDGILIVRIDAPIYFANVNTLREALHKYELRLEERLAATGRRLEFIIIDLSPVSDIDASAVHFLQEWIDEQRNRGVQPVFANPSRLVVRLMERAGIPAKVGADWISVRVHDAVLRCQEVMVERGLSFTTDASLAPALPVPKDVKDGGDDGGASSSSAEAAHEMDYNGSPLQSRNISLSQTEAELRRKDPRAGLFD